MKNEKKKPNLIFVTIDGLRSRNLSCYGYKRNTSPNIDSQAKQGVLFENFFSSYNCSHKSFLSILCYHKNPQRILKYAKQNNLEAFIIKLAEQGLRQE